MTTIMIPFPREMANAALAGRTCMTTRFEKMGDPGDEFKVDSAWFRLIDVQKAQLWWVRDYLYRLEGAETPAVFELIWRSLYRGHFSGDMEYYLHYFERFAGGEFLFAHSPVSSSTIKEAAPVIPFSREMANAALAGRKCMTTRFEKMGDPGDEFKVDSAWFRLIDVQMAPLRWVRDNAFRLEGAGTPAEFELIWRSIHGGNFPDDRECYLHFFGRSTKEESPKVHSPTSSRTIHPVQRLFGNTNIPNYNSGWYQGDVDTSGDHSGESHR